MLPSHPVGRSVRAPCYYQYYVYRGQEEAVVERRDESALSSEADYCFQGPRDEEQSLSLLLLLSTTYRTSRRFENLRFLSTAKTSSLRFFFSARSAMPATFLRAVCSFFLLRALGLLARRSHSHVFFVLCFSSLAPGSGFSRTSTGWLLSSPWWSMASLSVPLARSPPLSCLPATRRLSVLSCSVSQTASRLSAGLSGRPLRHSAGHWVSPSRAAWVWPGEPCLLRGSLRRPFPSGRWIPCSRPLASSLPSHRA